MHEFAEEYVANLKPREERYDTRLGDDFYVATFPNGVKTWVYVYQVNDFTRRQTLGIYPEMPLAQALESLYAARRTRAVEAELAEQGMDGTQLRHTEDSPINLTAKRKVPSIKLPTVNRRFLAGAVTGGVISLVSALGAWMFLTPGLVMEVPVQADVVDTVPQVIPSVAVAPSPIVTDPSETLAPAPPDKSVMAEPKPQPDREPEPEPTAVVAAEAAAPEAQPAEIGKSQQALRQLQQDLAGTLAWAQLTSEIKNGEPIDHLSWVVELDQASRRVFYFVRVRGMAGGTVTYRWRHQGKLLQEDSVRVGKGWHSPAYSGITLTQERLGRWQVEVIGPDGQSLGTEEFETRLSDDMARLSQR